MTLTFGLRDDPLGIDTIADAVARDYVQQLHAVRSPLVADSDLVEDRMQRALEIVRDVDQQLRDPGFVRAQVPQPRPHRTALKLAANGVSPGEALFGMTQLFSAAVRRLAEAHPGRSVEISLLLFPRIIEDLGHALDAFVLELQGDALLRERIDVRLADAWLSRQEVVVIGLIAEGASTKTIADELSISEPTVKRHIANIGQKLNAKGGRRAALQRARELGFLVAAPLAVSGAITEAITAIGSAM